MSSSEELPGQRRHRDTHPVTTHRSIRVIGERQRVVTPAPNAETLPILDTPTTPKPEPTCQLTSQAQKDRPLLLNEKSKPGIPRGVGVKATGSLPKTGWKRTQHTPKVKAARAKAKRWEERGGTNYGKPHKVRKAEKRSAY